VNEHRDVDQALCFPGQLGLLIGLLVVVMCWVVCCLLFVFGWLADLGSWLGLLSCVRRVCRVDWLAWLVGVCAGCAGVLGRGRKKDGEINGKK
jgi:hypothetical protein